MITRLSLMHSLMSFVNKSNQKREVSASLLFYAKTALTGVKTDMLFSSINWNLAGMPPRAMRAWCNAFCYYPDPLGIVTAKQLDKLEFV